MTDKMTVGRITQLVEPRCGACRVLATIYCPNCPSNEIARLDAEICQITDEKDRRYLQGLKDKAHEKRRKIMEA